MVTPEQIYEVQRMGVKALGFRCKSHALFSDITGLGYAVQIRDNQGGLTASFWVAWDKWKGAPVIEPAWNVNEVKD